MTSGELAERRRDIEKKFKEMGIDPSGKQPQKVFDYTYTHIPSPTDKNEKLSFDNNTNDQD